MPFANNKGVKIHYEVEGKGEPLILQHGNGGSLETWRIFGYVEDLSKDYQVILVDARAHGRSDKPHDSSLYNAETVAGDYAAILDELGIKNAGYWGYSMGGRIGFKCMARYNLPRLSYMILGGSTPFGVRTEEEKKQNEESLAMLRMAIEKGMESYVAFFEKRVGKMPPERRAQLLATDPRALIAFNSNSYNWPSSEDILPNLKIPCLVYCGDADARFAAAKEGAGLIPAVTFVSFHELNHMQTFSRSDIILPNIRKFIAEANKKN